MAILWGKIQSPCFLNFNFILALLVSLWVLYKIFKFVVEKRSLREEIKKLLPKNKLI